MLSRSSEMLLRARLQRYRSYNWQTLQPTHVLMMPWVQSHSEIKKKKNLKRQAHLWQGARLVIRLRNEPRGLLGGLELKKKKWCCCVVQMGVHNCTLARTLPNLIWFYSDNIINASLLKDAQTTFDTVSAALLKIASSVTAPSMSAG